MSGVTCHVSGFRCQVSDVMCHVSQVMCEVSHVSFFFHKMLELVWGGSVINGGLPSQVFYIKTISRDKQLAFEICSCVTDGEIAMWHMIFDMWNTKGGEQCKFYMKHDMWHAKHNTLGLVKTFALDLWCFRDLEEKYQLMNYWNNKKFIGHQYFWTWIVIIMP